MLTRARIALAGAALLTVALAGPARAASLSFTTFGDTEELGPNSVKLISQLPGAGEGGLAFNLPVAVHFAAIEVIKTSAVADAGDTCLGGTPRFELGTDIDSDGAADAEVHIYVHEPDAAVCPVPDTGNLADAAGPGDVSGRYVTVQLPGGELESTYSATAALFAANPSWRITTITLLTDGVHAHGDGRQAITVSPTVEVVLPGPASRDDCKNGGWMSLFRADGSAFRNQGDCIRYFNTGT